MASFAKLDNNNIVITVESVVNEVLKDSNGVEQEQLGIQFLCLLRWALFIFDLQEEVH